MAHLLRLGADDPGEAAAGAGVRHPALPPGPVAIAHRGGSLEAEENTLEAFQYAVGFGFRTSRRMCMRRGTGSR